MTTPRVTEMPLRLEPVQPDPFIEASEDREERVTAFRNGEPARVTERA
jgi:hypothetical protein